jgi:hypothetical protein
MFTRSWANLPRSRWALERNLKLGTSAGLGFGFEFRDGFDRVTGGQDFVLWRPNPRGEVFRAGQGASCFFVEAGAESGKDGGQEGVVLRSAGSIARRALRVGRVESMDRGRMDDGWWETPQRGAGVPSGVARARPG